MDHKSSASLDSTRTGCFDRESVLMHLFAETIPGISTRAFSEIARQYKVVIIVPLYEKATDGRFYNSAVIIDADGTLHTPYRKVHIPQDHRIF